MPLSTDGVVLAPNVLAVKHWDRLFGGVLCAATARVDWARLLRLRSGRRTFALAAVPSF